jgi:hypothetical protein
MGPTNCGSESTPDAPGPPGLTISEPNFVPLAGRLSIAIGIVPEDGSAGLRGTETVAH